MLAIGLSLVLGGALGNVIDRVWHCVRDRLHLLPLEGLVLSGVQRCRFGDYRRRRLPAARCVPRNAGTAGHASERRDATEKR